MYISQLACPDETVHSAVNNSRAQASYVLQKQSRKYSPSIFQIMTPKRARERGTAFLRE